MYKASKADVILYVSSGIYVGVKKENSPPSRSLNIHAQERWQLLRIVNGGKHFKIRWGGEYHISLFCSFNFMIRKILYSIIQETAIGDTDNDWFRSGCNCLVSPRSKRLENICSRLLRILMMMMMMKGENVTTQNLTQDSKFEESKFTPWKTSSPQDEKIIPWLISSVQAFWSHQLHYSSISYSHNLGDSLKSQTAPLLAIIGTNAYYNRLWKIQYFLTKKKD